MNADAMRKTREQNQLETREKLMAAAAEFIAKGGIGALSLRAICEKAGYSQGAFYSNFSSRDELLLAVMADHIHVEINALCEIIRSMAHAGHEALISRLAIHLSNLASQTHWSLLAMELQLHAHRDSAFAQSYTSAKFGYHTAFSELIRSTVDSQHLSTPIPVNQAAEGLYALWFGLILQQMPTAAPREDTFLAFLRVALGIAN